MRLWIDTDIGTDVDDALAIGYALRHPDIELVGVSTVFGDVELRARMVEELLRRASAAPCPVLALLSYSPRYAPTNLFNGDNIVS